MTAAGQNIKFRVWRMIAQDDDIVGGAVLSGTAIYNNVLGRMQEQPEEQMFSQQGLETLRTYTAVVVPGTLTLHERDELEIIAPYDHPYANDRFRITRVKFSDHNRRDPRNKILLNLTRSVRAHSKQ